MRLTLKISIMLLLPTGLMARGMQPDSLAKNLKFAKTDVERYHTLRQLGFYYLESDPVKSLGYYEQSISIAKRNNKVMDEAYQMAFKGYVLMQLGKYPESFQCLQQALAQADDETNESKSWNIEHIPTLRMNRLSVLAQIHHKTGLLMALTNNNEQAIVEYKKAQILCEQSDAKNLLGIVNLSLATAYQSIHQYDLALHSYKDAENLFQKIHFVQYLGSIYAGFGSLYQIQHQDNLALQYFYRAVIASQKGNNLNGVKRGYRYLTNYYIALKQPDSSLKYAIKALKVSQLLRSKDVADTYEGLYKSYKLNSQTDSAYKYQGLALIAKDSSFSATVKSLADFQKLSFKVQLHALDLEKEKAAIQTKIRTFVLLAGIGISMLLAVIFYRNNRQKRKANHLLSEQKEEMETQRDNLGQALEELKNTQTQLIQSEKMASLGELTAGIAHEIQNPLNFVNNFSEVSTELTMELKEELRSCHIEEAIAIADDLEQNLGKINHHGKRAGSIVKGMLEHSRKSSGTKEQTDMNQLADEYFRLSYHGLRAKDKTFNAELVTKLDNNLPKANVISQDIGRVMLNLFNNAFYAVYQKQQTAGSGYKPEVSVSTSAENNQVVIKVKDNGDGIPEGIRDKIMQPFFTTKPTGEGTGLGLSLSYDIVVKVHGGRIEVDSIEGQYTEFTISLPT